MITHHQGSVHHTTPGSVARPPGHLSSITFLSWNKERQRCREFCPPLSFSERTKLKDSEYPLISRILHGPCEKIARIFLMEADLGEEVPHEVSEG